MARAAREVEYPDARSEPSPPGVGTERHKRWLEANHHLEAALTLFDELGIGATNFAAHTQAGLDWSKRELRDELRSCRGKALSTDTEKNGI